MPYIKQEAREKFKIDVENSIQNLIDEFGDFSEGELNYLFSSIVWKLFENKRNYKAANTLVGVLESVKFEFYMRKVREYEDEKIEQNGDI